MPLTNLDINKLSTLISPHVDQVTCIECCKYYMVPSTAPCGHTLCHGCWIGRKKCATCGAGVNRKSLKINLPLQKMTAHTQGLRDEFEKIFKVNLDEFSLDTPVEKESSKDPTKNVRDWLANSENQFSAPEASQQSTQNHIDQQKEIGSKVQIHSECLQSNATKNIVHVGIPQDDWDKIEEMPDTEVLHIKNKENVVGPMDIEPLVADLFDFTRDKPRRSSRKRDVKGDTLLNTDVNSVNPNSTKDSTNETDSKVLKQNWANVKRMKKEFSKLNKKSKNKLNVSIEMCKKTLIPGNKNLPIGTVKSSEKQILNIDDDTPNIDNAKECVTLSKSVEKEDSPNNNIFKHVDEAKLHSKCKTHIYENMKQTTDNIDNHRNKLSNTQTHLPNSNIDQVPPVAFFVKGALQSSTIEENFECCNSNNPQTIIVNTENVEQAKRTEDIEITIKIGNTITNICIKKKENDVKLKINTDREIQTSLPKNIPINENKDLYGPLKEIEPENNLMISVQNNEKNISQPVKKCSTNDKVLPTVKTSSSKKNTESADTATVLYEITESIEKELSKEMEKEHVENTESSSKINKNVNIIRVVSDNVDVVDDNCLNDLDLFDNDSVKEGNVQTLKSSNHAPSEILMSTMKSNQSKKQIDKRFRDPTSEDFPVSKKMKIIHEHDEIGEIDITTKATQSKNQDSEITNYDFIMDKVFANIELDLAKKGDERTEKFSHSEVMKNDKFLTPRNSKATPNHCDSIHGQSENVFSLLEKESNVLNQLPSGRTQPRVENQEAPTRTNDHIELIDPELGTPLQENMDHSDESIVEETPQKNTSFNKVKQKSNRSLNTENIVKNKSLKLKRPELITAENKSLNTPNIMSVINLSDITDDTTRKSRQVTILDAHKSRPTLETPLTITNFVEQIKHKSTPMAKKSLNFDNQNTEMFDVDPEQTLCPNSFLVAKTTQEKEFMCKAFEDSPYTRPNSPPVMKNLVMRSKKYCLAGSCLTSSEISNVKLLCSLRKWDYVDKYTKDLTHLVVGVDEENKSQRSVKYMCALAASKWIVSYEWVQECLQMKKIVDEEPYEALDNTGEPGPRRSRVAKQKLFQGITFFCMPPFSVLDVDTLKEMLEAAGGRVVDEAKAVRVTGDSVTLLLAEPEHTQENRFIYLAMELSIVPVNSEWVLNCLGSYTISSVLELLLCPESLLPPATARWPPELMAKEFD